MKLSDVIRQARKEYRTSMDKIKAIALVRKITGRDLKEAKDFYEWMDANGEGMSAPKLAGHWCEEHWQDNEICGCPSVGITHVASAAVGGVKIMPDLEEFSPSPKPLAALPGVSKLVRANKDRCPCGRKPCTDEFHANFAALIRKYGSMRAVELVWIASGVMAPENEEQKRYVESLPGYRPIYREQQQ
jgi:hypothetical protein